MSAFLEGREAALQKVAELIADGNASTDVFLYLDEVSNEPLSKSASAEDRDFRLGVDAAIYGFLKEACSHFALYDAPSADAQYELMDSAFAKEAGIVDHNNQALTSDDVYQALGVIKEAGLITEDDLVSLEAAGLLSD